MIDVIGAADTTSTNALSRAAIGQEDFLKVLLAQLTYQDPMKPLDNNEFIAQFAQITALQQTQQTNDRLDNLLAFQSTNQAIELVGRTVEVSTESGTQIGTVTTVTFSAGVPELVISLAGGGSLLDVSLNQISVIR